MAANKDYLFTKENAAEKGRIGGIKSGEARRAKRDLKNVAKDLMALSIKKGDIDVYDSVEESKGKNVTSTEAIFLTMMMKAMKGDKAAAEFCFHYAGLEPAQEIDITADVNETNDELSNILAQLTEYKEEKNKK